MIDFSDFEFDPAKSEVNLGKHGIAFVSAQELWRDPDALELQARTVDERRHVVIGRIGPRIWAAIVTYRNGLIRIISVRRARREEVDLYEGS